MKRILSALFLLCTMAFGFHTKAAVYSGTCGDSLSWVLDTDIKKLIIAGTGAMRNYYETPWKSYKNYVNEVSLPNGLTNIGDHAFEGCQLNSVVIPNSVTTIGYCAFERCALTSAILGSGVKVINRRAFRLCTKLTSVIIPNNVDTIEEYAFENCTSLSSLTIGNSVRSIGMSAFESCTSLMQVNIPDNVKEMSSAVFKGCSSLQSAKIGSGVSAINYEAFQDCSALISLTISRGVENIGYNAFRNCSSLVSVSIPSSVHTIGSYAFHNCTSLSSVTIRSEVIGMNAFDGCKAIKNLIIPDNVKIIQDDAFRNCESLASLTIGRHLESIGDYVFSGCNALTSVTLNSDTLVKRNYNPYGKNIGTFFGSQVTNYVIGNSVTGIGEYAFRKSENISSIIVGDSVINIGKRAFEDCTGLTTVDLGNNVQTIGELAFYSCSSLTSINIPNSVSNIGYHAFYCCRSLPITNNIRYADTYMVEAVDKTLSSYAIKNGTRFIGDWGFKNCYNFQEIEIPNTIISIGEEAFNMCLNLKLINCLGYVPASLGYHKDIFYVNGGLLIYVPCSSMEAYKSAWTTYADIIRSDGLPYSINVNVNDTNMGSVSIPMTICEETSISAIPNDGYHFVQWSDGVSDNPRSVIVTKDSTFTAEFAINEYMVQFFGFNNVLLETQYIEHGSAAIAPEPPYIENYNFVGWDKDYSCVKSSMDIYAQYIRDTEGVNIVEENSTMPTKLFHNGQIFILRGDKTYTITGQHVK